MQQAVCDIAKLADHSRITTDAIILIVPSEFGCQQRPPVFGAAEAANPSEPVVHLFAGLGELLAGGSSNHRSST